jgi:hypothetical protein
MDPRARQKARRQLARPESEHVVREYPDLAIIDMETWERVQERMQRQARGSICSNATMISEKKITEALLEALRETLSVRHVAEAFAESFERRVADRAKLGAGEFEKQLRAAETR